MVELRFQHLSFNQCKVPFYEVARRRINCPSPAQPTASFRSHFLWRTQCKRGVARRQPFIRYLRFIRSPAHPQRAQNSLLQKFAEGLAAHFLHHSSQYYKTRVAIRPCRSWFEVQLATRILLNEFRSEE